MIAHLIRHGDKAQGSGDLGLSELGVRQAHLTGQSLAGRSITRLYASPLKRTMETALIIGHYLGLQPVVESAVRERLIYGDRPGETPEEYLEVWEHTCRDRDFAPPNGDSSRTAGERLDHFLRNLALAEPTAEVVIATHGGIVTDLLRNHYADDYLEAQAPGRMHYPNCAITTLEVTEAGIHILRLVTVDHLG